MYSVGIDASKGKSTICILKETGECILTPRDFNHTKDDLESLDQTIRKLTGKNDVRIVMEATGIYHWPLLLFLKRKGYFVSVINPLRMKLFAKNYNFRGVKTDKYDSTIIAAYGCEKWFSLQQWDFNDDTRDELKRLARSYVSYQKPKISVKQSLDLELEKCMPGIKNLFSDDQKLYSFILFFLRISSWINLTGGPKRKDTNSTVQLLPRYTNLPHQVSLPSLSMIPVFSLLKIWLTR